MDTGVAVYYRYVANVDTRVSYVSHLAGAAAGKASDSSISGGPGTLEVFAFQASSLGSWSCAT